MRRLPALSTAALTVLAVFASAQAALADTAPTSPAAAVQAPAPGPAADRTAATARPLADPGPECTGQSGGCWEYYSWYWTYSSCHEEGRAQLQANPRRYDNYNCAGGHGLVVWLWLHRP